MKFLNQFGIETPNQEVTIEAINLPFTDIRPQWKELAKNKSIEKSDIAALCIYRSIIKGEDINYAIEKLRNNPIGRIRKAFRPITNEIKLKNGRLPYDAALEALIYIRTSTVLTWLTKDESSRVISIAEKIWKEKLL